MKISLIKLVLLFWLLFESNAFYDTTSIRRDLALNMQRAAVARGKICSIAVFICSCLNLNLYYREQEVDGQFKS